MRSVTRALLPMLVALALVSGDARAADECGDTCDARCSACCQAWTLRATCSNGKGVALQGVYSSWREASTEADATNLRVKSCAGPGSGSCSDYHRCGAEVAVWTPWCSPDQSIVRPSESALAAKELEAVRNVCDAQLAVIDDVMPKLAAFASANTLTSSAAGEAARLQGALPALKARVAALRSTAIQMRDARKATAAAARKFRQSQDRLLQDTVSGVDRARRLMSDSASIDRTAQEADKVLEQVRTSLDDTGKQVKAHSDQLSAFLAQKNLTPAASKKGGELARKLESLKARTAGAQEELTAARAKAPPGAAIAAVRGVRTKAQPLIQEVNVACGVVKALIDDKASYSQDKVEPPPSSPPPQEGGCEILFEPATGATGLTISIDGGAVVKLPAKARVASGQHAITVRKASASEQRSELILCGRVSRIEITEPK